MEIVRNAYDAWNRGDRDAWVDAFDEEGEFYPLRAVLERGGYKGHEAIRRFLTEMDEDWDFVRFHVDEIRDSGEQVLGLGEMHASARGSGVDLRFPVGAVVRVRRGKIIYFRTYTDRDEALEAAGLSE